MKKALNAIVFGNVQGVFYRANTKNMAERLGITGFVRNKPDGSVEVWAEASEEKLNEFIEFLKKGPRNAEVKDLQINWETPKGYTDFKILY